LPAPLCAAAPGQQQRRASHPLDACFRLQTVRVARDRIGDIERVRPLSGWTAALISGTAPVKTRDAAMTLAALACQVRSVRIQPTRLLGSSQW
jgi:hypothetical protein